MASSKPWPAKKEEDDDTQTTEREVAEYSADMTAQLALLAQGNGLDDLAAILRCATVIALNTSAQLSGDNPNSQNTVACGQQ